MYKVASFEINHIPLLEEIGKTKKPVIVSTGTANIKDIDLENTLKRLVDKIRFYEYFLSFKKDKDGRGFNFEGLLAGLTGGKPIISQRKEDIKIGEDYYSVKLTQPGERFDLGSLSSGFKAAKIKMVEEDPNVQRVKQIIFQALN